mmetsp:Transcript_24873/g.68303  ORF Transcript_24873/g.68303 Transcript_24873/m.68303 type:complete len:237 (+) Transcript_24873:828-1538(+)
MDNRLLTSGEGWAPPSWASCRLSSTCSTSWVCLSKARSCAARKVQRYCTWACRGLALPSSPSRSRDACQAPAAARSSSLRARSRRTSARCTRTCACRSSGPAGASELRTAPALPAGTTVERARLVGGAPVQRSCRLRSALAADSSRLHAAPKAACARQRHRQATASWRRSCACASVVDSLTACRCTSEFIHRAWPSAVSAACSNWWQRSRHCQSRRWVSTRSRSASALLALNVSSS